jgi:hypothetical protein
MWAVPRTSCCGPVEWQADTAAATAARSCLHSRRIATLALSAMVHVLRSVRVKLSNRSQAKTGRSAGFAFRSPSRDARAVRHCASGFIVSESGRTCGPVQRTARRPGGLGDHRTLPELTGAGWHSTTTLVEMENRPWPEWKGRRPLTVRQHGCDELAAGRRNAAPNSGISRAAAGTCSVARGQRRGTTSA